MDYLSISPARSGTSWLRVNLNQHPDIFVFPTEIQTFGINRLTSYDRAGSPDKINIDISPHLAMVTRADVHLLHWYNPNLKFIFILRNPVTRAWSHLRHMQTFREGYFQDHTEPNWEMAARHHYNLVNSDYPEIWRRYANVFGPNRIFVRLFEEILLWPLELLDDLCRFLEVDKDVFPRAFDRVNTGDNSALDKHVLAFLQKLYSPIVREVKSMFPHLPFTLWQTFPDVPTEEVWNYTELDVLKQQYCLSRKNMTRVPVGTLAYL